MVGVLEAVMITTKLVKFSELVEGDLYTGLPVEDWDRMGGFANLWMLLDPQSMPEWKMQEQTYKVTIDSGFGPPLSGWQPPQPVKER